MKEGIIDGTLISRRREICGESFIARNVEGNNCIENIYLCSQQLFNRPYELPIVAFPIKRWKKFASIERIKSLLKNRKSAKDSFKAKTSSGEGKKSSKLDKIKYFFQDEWQTWDYCLFSSSLHNEFLKEIKKQRERKVITLVGHPKGYMGENGFKHLLEKTAKEYNFQTINDICNEL